MELLASTASIFAQILAFKPQNWKFLIHKPPNLEIFSSQAPSFRGKNQFASPTYTPEIRATHPYLKKISGPPDCRAVLIDFSNDVNMWQGSDPICQYNIDSKSGLALGAKE